MLVERRNVGIMFAIKMKVIKQGVQQGQEGQCSFSFLVKLESHFQTGTSLCLVVELVRGGDWGICCPPQGDWQL